MELSPFAYVSMAVAGAGLLALLAGVYYFCRSLATRRWPATDGRVEVATVIHDSVDDTYQTTFTYLYQIKDLTYRGERLFFGDGMLLGEEAFADHVSRRYRAGQTVRVYHHPRRLGACVLEPGVNWRIYTWHVFALGLIAVGVAGYFIATGEVATVVNHYRNDLAFIHDAGYGKVARAAAAMLLDDLRSRGVSRGAVLDLGCGSGILSEPIAQAGFDAIGIDLSPAFVAMAEARVPTGLFRVGSLLTEPLSPCVAAACVGECVSYLFDPVHSWDGVRAFFGRVFDALAPGGVFLVDLVTPGRVPGGGPTQAFNEGDGWVVLVTGVEADGVVTRRITTFRRAGELWRRDDETHAQRTLPPAAAAAMLTDVGFAAEQLPGYGDVRFPAGVAGFRARKPG